MARKFAPKVPGDLIQEGTSNTEIEETEKTVQEDSNITEADVKVEETVQTEENVQTEDTTTEAEVEEVKEPETTEKVVFVDTTVKQPIEVNVKIKVGSNYNCTIGGTRYFFEKGKTYNVPQNVKNILSRENNLLKPL